VRDSAFATSSRHGAREDNGGDGWADLAPLPGRMVLFDSSEIWHEVRPTLAPRYCVVGWFRTPIGS
jgi:SM-20-related protein